MGIISTRYPLHYEFWETYAYSSGYLRPHNAPSPSPKPSAVGPSPLQSSQEMRGSLLNSGSSVSVFLAPHPEEIRPT